MNAPATRKKPLPGVDIGLRRFDHLELYVGNARQAARFYEATFGFRTTHFRGLETGSRDAASYVIEQGHIRLVLTSALSPEHPAAVSTAAATPRRRNWRGREARRRRACIPSSYVLQPPLARTVSQQPVRAGASRAPRSTTARPPHPS